MNKLSKFLSTILAASLIALAASGPLQASVSATSFIDITNFVIKDGGVHENPADAILDQADFTALSYTTSADVDVALGANILSESTPTADLPTLCLGTCPTIADNVFPVISGAPTTTYSTVDQLQSGVPIMNAQGTAPAYFANGTYVAIDDTQAGTASSNTNNNLNAKLIFNQAHASGVTFEFDVRAYKEAFVSGTEAFPGFATASTNLFITLVNLTTGEGVFSWNPNGNPGGISGGIENTDAFTLNHTVSLNAPLPRDITSTGGIHTLGVASTGTFSATTAGLVAGHEYQLSLRIESNADALRVEQQLASLGDRVWEDLDADGDQDCTTPTGDIIGNGDDGCLEPGIPNVIVNLLTPGNDGNCDTNDEVFVATTTTDADGFYLFTGLVPGSYCVEFDKPSAGRELQCVAAAGVQSSPQDAINVGDTVDSDASPSSGQTGNIDLDAGETDLTNDAGFYCPAQQPASLGDRVWNDLDADGDQDCTDPMGAVIGDGDDDCEEPGIPGVTVNLYENCDANGNGGVFVTSMPTDADGFYLFDNLLPGTYCVEFDKNSAGQQLQCRAFIGGVESSPQDAVGVDDTLDSDAHPTTGRTGDISLLAGDNNLTNDAGFYCPAKIGDYLIDDRNRDGLQGDLADEPGVGGQLVELVECVGGVAGTDVIDSQLTDPDGMYMFNPLPPGEYAVKFSKPGDTEFSPQDQGVDEAKDCDTNPNGFTECVTLGTDEYNQDVDACINIPPVAGLGDFVWEDLNVDGQQNGEPGIPGVTVNLLRPGLDNNCNTDDDVAVAGPDGTTTTAANGFYEFRDLQPGRYCVEFDIDSLPGDFCTTDGFELGSPQFTLRDVGVNTGDSDADTRTGKTGNIDLGDDEYDPTNDAGIYCPAKIGDLVWEDADKDGLQDNSELGVPDVEVRLIDCGANGEIGGGDDSDTGESRFTDVDGMYMFGAEPGVLDLPPGSYYVQFIKPDGTEFTTPDVPSVNGDAVDSDCSAPDGITECITLGSRGINLTRDCGIIPPPPPECDLVIDKTCLVETPPPPAFDKCDGKLAQFTVIWTGGDITISGLPNDAPGGQVSTNDEVTFFGPFSDNDVFVNITGDVDGQSKFHMSCSDDDFNSPDDCSKPAGDGKGTNDGFINAWKLEGFIDKNGTVLDCTSGSSAGFPDQDNCVFTPQPANCDILGKPTSLTFRYTGAGCGASSNSQDSDTCTGDVNGLEAVDIVVGKKGFKDIYTATPDTVLPNGEFTVSSDNFGGDSEIWLSNDGGTEKNIFHTSCSKPLEVGDVFGSLVLVGFNGLDGGVDVTYGYTITNNGDPLMDIILTDNKLGTIADGFSLVKDESMQFTRTTSITETTTNVASAIGLFIDKEECPAVADTVTVEVEIPMTPVSCSDIKDITAVSVVWNGLGAVDITTESGEMFLDVQPGNKITFQEAGTGNDVELYISGTTNGTSKFHVSCSDDDMNGTEDCGSNQGDGKGTDSDFINTWLFDGMTGENGSFDCQLPNTGVVDPAAGKAPSTGNVTAGSTLDLSDDKVKWELTNNGTQDVFITRVMVTWPAGHEQVKKFKLDGDFAKDVFDGGGSTVVPDDKAFESDASKRRLKAGDNKNLEIEFTEKSKDHVQGDYTIKVDFDNGQVLMFP